MSIPRSSLAGGVAGMVSIVCALLAIFVNWREDQLSTSVSLIVASAFPILGIIAGHALHGFIAAERDGTANRLAFVFIVTAFATLLAMLVVQLAVVSGVAEVTGDLDAQTARALRRGLRIIDQGLDVAWDLLIGTTLILWGVALRTRTGFGAAWAFPSAAFGVLLIGLNAATFPWPPNTRGLFDIGPFIAVFMFALYARLAFLGRRALQAAPGENAPRT